MSKEVVNPPDLAETLICLKIDHVTRFVNLNQNALLDAFRKYKDYIRDLNAQSCRQFRDEIELATTVVKNECLVQVTTKQAELEHQLTKKFEKLDSDAIAAKMNKMDMKLGELQKRFAEVSRVSNQANQQAESALRKAEEIAEAQEASSTQGKSVGAEAATGERPRPGARSPSEVEAGGGSAYVHPKLLQQLLPLPNKVKKLEDQFRAVQTSGPTLGIEETPAHMQRAHSGATSEDLEAVKNASGNLKEGLDATNRRMKEMRAGLEEQITAVEKRITFAEEASLRNNEIVEQIKARLDKQDVAFNDLVSRVEDIRADVDKLGARAEEIAERCAYEVGALKTTLMDQVSSTGAVAQKLFGKADTGLIGLKAEIKAEAQRGEVARAEMRSKLQSFAEEAKKAEQQNLDEIGKIQKSFDERLGKVDEREDLAADNMAGLHANVTKLWEFAVQLGGKNEVKADQAEVQSLKVALSGVAAELKDKEQAVLFGAKCLSCNRVFDDVSQESGVVDVRGERQRAQLFAEVQRALHNPNTDPSKPLKMLAVKVGRPGGIASPSKTASFLGRDGTNFACGIEDVHLLPAPPGWLAERRQPAAAEHVAATLPPTSSTVSPLPPPSPRSARPVRRLAGPTHEAGQRGAVYDFKHPISTLVSR